MKIIYLSLLFVLFFSVACKKDTVNPQQIITNDSSLTSGQLTIYTQFLQNSKYVDAENANVRLYATYEDLKNDLYIFSLNTSNQGKAYFGYVNIGTYYAYSEHTYNGVLYQKEIALQVRSQKNEKVTMTLEEVKK